MKITNAWSRGIRISPEGRLYSDAWSITCPTPVAADVVAWVYRDGDAWDVWVGFEGWSVTAPESYADAAAALVKAGRLVQSIAGLATTVALEAGVREDVVRILERSVAQITPA